MRPNSSTLLPCKTIDASSINIHNHEKHIQAQFWKAIQENVIIILGILTTLNLSHSSQCKIILVSSIKYPSPSVHIQGNCSLFLDRSEHTMKHFHLFHVPL